MRAYDLNTGAAANIPNPLAGSTLTSPASIGVGTLSASVDPGPSNDSSTGVQVGTVWFNSAAGFLRWWECRDSTPGAAKWVFSGADYANGGTNPASEVTQAGSSTAVVAAEGNINRQVLSGGTSPAGTGSDYVIGIYSLPPNAFDGVGNRGVNIMACGSIGSNANTKTVKIIAGVSNTAVGGTAAGGGTTIASLVVSGTGAAPGFQISANIFKYGVAGSNTQLALHEASQAGNVVGTLLQPSTLGLVENAQINIAITGNANPASDISLDFFELNWMN